MMCMRDLGVGCFVVVVSVVSESNGRPAFERTPQSTGQTAGWVEQSNRHAQMLLEISGESFKALGAGAIRPGTEGPPASDDPPDRHQSSGGHRFRRLCGSRAAKSRHLAVL